MATGELMASGFLGYAGANHIIWASTVAPYGSAFTVVFSANTITPTRYFGQAEGFSLAKMAIFKNPQNIILLLTKISMCARMIIRDKNPLVWYALKLRRVKNEEKHK